MSDEPKPDPVLVPIPAPDQPGVLRADVDAVYHAVTIDFHPRVISDEGVRKVAEKLAPASHQQCLLGNGPFSRKTKVQRRTSAAAREESERENVKPCPSNPMTAAQGYVELGKSDDDRMNWPGSSGMI